MSAYGNAAVAQSVERRLVRRRSRVRFPSAALFFCKNEVGIYSLQIWELVPTFFTFSRLHDVR